MNNLSKFDKELTYYGNDFILGSDILFYSEFTEKVDKDSVIAVLPVGYYDGYFRKLSSAAEVLVGGKRCKILGRISMNLSVVDISVAKNPRVLDEVVLIGKQGGEEITAEELAKQLNKSKRVINHFFHKLEKDKLISHKPGRKPYLYFISNSSVR